MLLIKKHLLLMIIFILLLTFVFFAIVGIINKDRFSFIKKKLKVSALTGNGMFYSISDNYRDSVLTCYKSIINNIISISQKFIQNGEIFLNISKMNIIKGYIENSDSNYYSYKIIDKDKNEIVADNINTVYLDFEGDLEEFEIIFDKKINSGKYVIYFYSFEKRKQKNYADNYVTKYFLNIMDKIA